jgi:hypothetical protein
MEENAEKAFFIKDLEGNSQKDLSNYVKNIQSMSELMSYNGLYGTSVLDLILRDIDGSSSFFQKLDLI